MKKILQKEEKRKKKQLTKKNSQTYSFSFVTDCI